MKKKPTSTAKKSSPHYTRKEIVDGFPVPPATLAPVEPKVGPLAMLIGQWTGQGNTMLAVPAKEGLFRGINHPTTNETLTYTVSTPAPNRGGFEQPDVFLTGLRYHHQVSDAKTNEALHDEIGFWLNVPATINPKAPAGIIRELSIPHGNAAILFGQAKLIKGAYKFPPFHAIPSPRENFPFPSIYDSDNTGDVNKQLNEAQKGLTILKTQVLTVATRTPGDVVNIPFLTQQAASTSVTATFAIAIATRETGEPFMMLQYSQVILLQFPAVKDGPMISWPHTAVATLYKTA